MTIPPKGVSARESRTGGRLVSSAKGGEKTIEHSNKLPLKVLNDHYSLFKRCTAGYLQSEGHDQQSQSG